ncbi:2,3-bisphosphoglycerate-dependent phosphoglycerate mutase [Thraustotheca clavata]|uniref:phosphoglycerate mutase (2,3-diphosphoglycerate-dependent) n=1 Tax=Thraustotheca clavata TaxID=74557 RepID=A0A1V9ZP84_9STRA|nr:2,3-bisphosphoglycerate-dependent phosphoglycerate mutase [Thraustotheca clavata]
MKEMTACAIAGICVGIYVQYVWYEGTKKRIQAKDERGLYVRKASVTCEYCCAPEPHILPHSHSMVWDDNMQLMYMEKHPESTGRLILMRHGQSVWNRKPDRPDDTWRYAGTVDIPLSDVGIQEALQAGESLQNIPLDMVFCSQMDRARATVSLALSIHESGRTPIIVYNSPLDRPDFEDLYDVDDPTHFAIPVYVTPTLNERNFGSLQGVPSTQHPKNLAPIRNEFNLKFPGEKGESCADIEARTMPFFNKFIVPQLAAGKNVLVSTHGFVIRTIMKSLENMDENFFNAQMKLEKSNPNECRLLAPTGVPIMYQYENGAFIPVPQSRRDRAKSIARSAPTY